jgi:hypothetical protein
MGLWFASGCVALDVAGAKPADPAHPPAPPAVQHPDGIAPVMYTPQESPQDRIATLSQMLSATDEERKVLGTRLQRAESLLAEKEEGLVLAGTEINAAIDEVSRTRKEIQRCKQEISELRDRLRKSEKESKDVLGETIRLLERALERLADVGEPRPAPEPSTSRVPTPG